MNRPVDRWKSNSMGWAWSGQPPLVSRPAAPACGSEPPRLAQHSAYPTCWGLTSCLCPMCQSPIEMSHTGHFYWGLTVVDVQSQTPLLRRHALPGGSSWPLRRSGSNCGVPPPQPSGFRGPVAIAPTPPPRPVKLGKRGDLGGSPHRVDLARPAPSWYIARSCSLAPSQSSPPRASLCCPRRHTSPSGWFCSSAWEPDCAARRDVC